MIRIGSLTMGLLATFALLLATSSPSAAFVAPSTNTMATPKMPTALFKKKMDLSDIESRDMTREEMLELNKQTEQTMQNELALMTGFSLAVSIPILYLCWVAFFSD